MIDPPATKRLTKPQMSECSRMNIDTTCRFLLWCAVINYGILIVWFLVFTLAHDSLHQLHARMFRISTERFDSINYAAMALYKIGVLLLNLVPYIALRMVG